MIIYQTKKLINEKIYVGKDTKNNPNYLGSGIALKNSIKKYGKENFKKTILEICKNNEELEIREKYWIKKLNTLKNGYNMTEGGTGGYTGIPWNKGLTKDTSNKLKETGEKISKKLKGHKQSEETKNKRNEKLTGIKRSDETKRKLSIALTGKKMSDETKRKLSIALTGKKMSDETKQKMRGREWSEESKQKISNALKGKKNHKKL